MKKTQQFHKDRKGTITTLMAFLLPVLLIVSAFTINIAFLQLTRTELMIATDAAARAGGRGISHFQNIEDAMQVASNTAALNLVNGQPLLLNANDQAKEIDFGDAEPDQASERFIFNKVQRSQITNGAEQAAAIRITGKMGGGISLTNPVTPIFPTFGVDMLDEFEMSSVAVAMQVDRDIALILDRSGSMDFHPGWDWPSGFNPFTWDPVWAAHQAGLLGYNPFTGRFHYLSGQNSETLQDWIWTTYLNLGTAPQRPWEELLGAVDSFLQVLEGTDQDEQVSIASYASTATLDVTLQTDYDIVRAELATLSPSGNTAIGDGMRAGIPSLLDEISRPYAAKTLLVMTDGVHNRGSDPRDVARDIVSQYDVVIHTITFGAGAEQSTMQAVATIGGGEHFHAADGDALQTVLEEIANNLPTIVTQ